MKVHKGLWAVVDPNDNLVWAEDSGQLCIFETRGEAQQSYAEAVAEFPASSFAVRKILLISKIKKVRI